MKIVHGRPLGRRGLLVMLSFVVTAASGGEARAGLVDAGSGSSLLTDVGEYRDTRWDPDPPTGGPEYYETIRIDRTTRSVWTGTDGTRWLTVVVAPFDRNFYTQVKVHLDTDGDRAAEFEIIFQSHDNAGEGCWLRALSGGGRIEARFRRLQPGVYPDWVGPVACRVPLGLVRPTARIAWWSGAGTHDTSIPGWRSHQEDHPHQRDRGDEVQAQHRHARMLFERDLHRPGVLLTSLRSSWAGCLGGPPSDDAVISGRPLRCSLFHRATLMSARALG